MRVAVKITLKNMRIEVAPKSADAEGDLPLSKYQNWYDAIINDDVTAVKHIIESAKDDNDRKKLINGSFIFDTICIPDSKCLSNMETFSVFAFPIFLAASSGSRGVLLYIIENGGNVLVQDADGQNLIHVLILTLCGTVDNENAVMEMYDCVMQSIPLEMRRGLLMMENRNQLRPVEFASAMAKFRFTRKILETEGIYKFHSGNLGSRICYYYDITDYEEKSAKRRRGKSPLDILTHIQHEHLMDPGLAELLSMPMMLLWVKGKVQANRNGVFLWLLIRVLYHVLVMFVSTPYVILIRKMAMRNVSSTMPPQNVTPGSDDDRIVWQHILLLSFIGSPVIIVLLNGAIHLYRFLKLWINRNGTSSYAIGVMRNSFGVVRSPLHPSLLFVLSVGIALMPLFLYLDKMYLLAMTFVLVSFCNLWSCLFGLQFAPVIGRFVLIFSHLLPHIAPFFLFMFLIFCAFAVCFSTLNTMFSYHSHDFRDFKNSLYSCFRIMLNMQDLSELNDRFGFASMLLHILCVVILSIVLVNFLVALMSNSMAEIYQQRDLVHFLHIFRAAQIMDDSWITKIILRKLCRKKRLDWLHTKNSCHYIICYETKKCMS